MDRDTYIEWLETRFRRLEIDVSRLRNRIVSLQEMLVDDTSYWVARERELLDRLEAAAKAEGA